MASRPDRLQIDLANVKALALALEDEAAKLRQLSPEKPRKPVVENEGDGDAEGKESGDAVMADADGTEEETEPAERGSEAVERKVNKLMDDFVQQGLIDPADRKAYEAKKVSWNFLVQQMNHI